MGRLRPLLMGSNERSGRISCMHVRVAVGLRVRVAVGLRWAEALLRHCHEAGRGCPEAPL